MTDAQSLARVRRTLDRCVPGLGTEGLGADDPLPGAFDSLALVATAVGLEREFGIRVRPADLTSGAFRSLASIARLAVARLSEK